MPISPQNLRIYDSLGCLWSGELKPVDTVNLPMIFCGIVQFYLLLSKIKICLCEVEVYCAKKRKKKNDNHFFFVLERERVETSARNSDKCRNLTHLLGMEG